MDLLPAVRRAGPPYRLTAGAIAELSLVSAGPSHSGWPDHVLIAVGGAVLADTLVGLTANRDDPAR